MEKRTHLLAHDRLLPAEGTVICTLLYIFTTAKTFKPKSTCQRRQSHKTAKKTQRQAKKKIQRQKGMGWEQGEAEGG